MKTKAIKILLVLAILIGVALVFGCKEKAEAKGLQRYSFDITEAAWMFEGTFCSECNQLYNYIEHPKICDVCGTQTKDFFYLVLIKERE